MGADADLSALSSRVFSGLARPADGAWDASVVSAALRDLHASLRLQLAEQERQFADNEAQLETLRGDAAPREARAFLDKVERVTQEIEGMAPQVGGAEAHFAELAELLAPTTQRLLALDARAKYLATALEIERRSQQARESAVEAATAALDAFRAFAAFVATIPSEYSALRNEAMRRVDELSLGIKTYAVQKLETALESVEWPRVVPKEELESEKEKLAEIARAFAYLLTLHVSQLEAEEPQKKLGGTNDSASAVVTELWAMECVLEPIRMRFKYHFERAESKTNRVTKPEWWLNHVLDQTRAHGMFLSSILTPELKKYRDALDCVDAQVLFLRGLTLTAMKKLRKDLPVILSERVVFCHTIDEVLLFEQLVDEEFGYDSYAASKPLDFPRMVDVLTEDTKTLVAWTQVDVEYAKETLESSVLTQKDAWNLASQVPPAASQFTALLDFMCRRFAHFSSEGHRYVYISKVVFTLLQDFHHQCANRARQVNVKTLVEIQQPITPFFAVVNAAQHLVNVLEQWDENPFFIELMRKVAESEKSRTQILKIHLQHSKVMLKNAAKAATESIMAREEAVAVRQAIAGPGAMIGPTAAFSAAYSVGSKTVKSLFGRGLEENVDFVRVPVGEPAQGGDSAPIDAVEPEVEAEALLFSRTIFERHVRDYKMLTATLIGELESAVVGPWRRALNKYRKSPMWSLQTTLDCIELDISSELGPAVTVLQRVLEDARRCLFSGDCFSQLWKPLAATLDDAIFSTASAILTASIAPSSGAGFSLSNAATAIGAVEPISPHSSANGKSAWSTPARAQFIYDVNATASLFQKSCTKNPRAYLRKTFDLCRLVEMPSSKMTEIHEALRGIDAEDEGNDMEQITTILEACNILTLTPQQPNLAVLRHQRMLADAQVITRTSIAILLSRMVSVRPLVVATQLAVRLQTTLQHGPAQPNIVVLSSPFFVLVGIGLMWFHILCAVLNSVWAYVHIAMSFNSDAAGITYIGLIESDVAFEIAGYVFALCSAAHVLAVVRLLYASAKRGEIVLSETHETRLPRSCTNNIVTRWLWDPYVAMKKRFPDEIFVLQEAVQIALLSRRAYGLTRWQPRSWLLRAYVTLVVLNCWSSPVIQWLQRRTKTRRRMFWYTFDMVSDLLSTLVLPAAMTWPQLPLFDPNFVWYRGSDVTEDLSRYQRRIFQGVAQSWFDVFNIGVFSIFLFSRVVNIRASLQRRDDITCTATVSIAPTHPSTVPKRLSVSTHRGSDTVMHMIHAVAIVWGVAIVIAQCISETRPIYAWCIAQTAPWFTTGVRCETVKIDCAASQIQGYRSEMDHVFATLLHQEVLTLSIAECPALEVPAAIQTLRNLNKIYIKNSTLVQWDQSAAILDRYQPDVRSISITNSRFPNGVPDGLCCFGPLPRLLNSLVLDNSNLTSLPDKLDTVWHDPFRLVLDGNAFTSIPPVATRLPLLYLSMASNKITTVPVELLTFHGDFSEIQLTKNPIEALPDLLPSGPRYEKLPFLWLDNTALTRLPSWIWRVQGVNATGTPFCGAYTGIPQIRRTQWLEDHGLDKSIVAAVEDTLVCEASST